MSFKKITSKLFFKILDVFLYKNFPNKHKKQNFNFYFLKKNIFEKNKLRNLKILLKIFKKIKK